MNEKSLKTLDYDKIKDLIKKYANTEASKSLIDNLRPYNNVYEVREHLEETEEALKLILKKGAPPFDGIYDVREALSLAQKGYCLRPEQLLKLAQMLRCARRFKDYIYHKEDEEGYRVIEDICIGIVPLQSIENKIFEDIISENEISDRASQELYSIRKRLKEKEGSVKDKVNSMVRGYSKYLQENLYTMRGDRYVLPVRSEYKAQVQGIVHDQSGSGATMFIEPIGLVNLNNDIAELKLKEKAEIERILSSLSQRIYDSISAVKNNSNIINELDFIFAKAKYACENDCINPIVNENGNIDLITARHPLINKNDVVSNDIYLGREFTSLVITGPNTGGKTITLKTVGILEIMALSGIMIPARSNSSVGFFSEVFADIGDEQSIEQSLSTFSSHMTNIVNIMDKADDKSLVLFDELGAGTDPTEGAALAVAILEELKKRGTKIIATTHYSELKGYALKSPMVENASVEFNIETLRPTYRLLTGVPGKSNAFEISKRLGLPNYIIESSKEKIAEDSLKFEDLIQSLQEKSIKAEQNARETENLKLQIEKIKQDYEEKLFKLNKSKEKIMNDAQREAKKIIRETKDEADGILKGIRELERKGYSFEARQELEEQRKKLKDKLDETDNKINESINDDCEKLNSVEEGQEVYVPSLNQNVIVISKPDNKGEVLVQAGILKINVKLENLRLPKQSKEDKKKNKIYKKREAKLKLASVSPKIDLRGLDSMEAVFLTDKYLDDAYMAGLSEVTVVHGKGTGILRSTINDMLKKHTHVKNYRLGNYGEGGTGVTVVQLK